uniref:ELFV_dehydrog domain-containing protein n=1 Tax=Anisakis simplex TaxID=6269 RepID=A0A0M3JGA8_ANISI
LLSGASKRFVSSAQIKVKPFKLHNVESGPNTEVTLTRDDALQIYTRMMVKGAAVHASNSAATLIYGPHQLYCLRSPLIHILIFVYLASSSVKQ